MKAPDSSRDSSRRERLRNRLLVAARTRTEDQHVPSGFAHRVQRHIAMRESAASLDGWIRGFWQALIPAVGCLVLVLALQPRTTTATTTTTTTTTTAGREADLDSDAAEITLWEALDANTTEVEL